jgi:hypothetical protein
LRAGVQELDGKHVLAAGIRLPDQLIESLLLDDAFALRIRV